MLAQRTRTALRLLKEPSKFYTVCIEKGLGRKGSYYFYSSITKRLVYRYKLFLHRKPAIERPVSLNEKIQWTKKYCPDVKRMAVLADKYLSAQYAAEHIDSKHIVPTLYYGDDFTAESLRELAMQQRIVIKTTHQSGQVVDVENPELIDWDKLVTVLKNNLKWPYSMVGQEPWYGHVAPAIIVQPFLRSHSGNECLDDAKFHIFNRQDGTQFVLAWIVNQKEKWAISFDQEGNVIDHDLLTARYLRPKEVPELPDYWDAMLKDALCLSQGFGFVRIDFMMASDTYYFAEFTFAPNGGYLSMEPQFWDEKLGSFWDLDTGTMKERLLWFWKAWGPLWRTERPMRNILRLYRFRSEWAYINESMYLKSADSVDAN